MDQRELYRRWGKARGMEYADLGRAGLWMEYARGIRPGYFEEKFGTDRERVRWWGDGG